MGEPPSENGGANETLMESWPTTDSVAFVGGPGTEMRGEKKDKSQTLVRLLEFCIQSAKLVWERKH